MFRFKSCFPSIMLSNTDLMIPTTQIQFCKVSCMFQLIKQIINARKRIPVFNGDFVKGPVVDTHPPRPILLWNQDYGRATRRSARPDDPLLNQLLNLLLDLLILHYRHPVHGYVREWHILLQMYLMLNLSLRW